MKRIVRHDVLTPREMQVLYLLVCGRSAREAADMLRITQHTVRRHRRCIFEKLDVRNVAELLRKALLDGWSTLPDRLVREDSRSAISR